MNTNLLAKALGWPGATTRSERVARRPRLVRGPHGSVWTYSPCRGFGSVGLWVPAPHGAEPDPDAVWDGAPPWAVDLDAPLAMVERAALRAVAPIADDRGDVTNSAYELWIVGQKVAGIVATDGHRLTLWGHAEGEALVVPWAALRYATGGAVGKNWYLDDQGWVVTWGCNIEYPPWQRVLSKCGTLGRAMVTAGDLRRVLGLVKRDQPVTLRFSHVDGLVACFRDREGLEPIANQASGSAFQAAYRVGYLLDAFRASRRSAQIVLSHGADDDRYAPLNIFDGGTAFANGRDAVSSYVMPRDP